jgi:DAHL domain
LNAIVTYERSLLTPGSRFGRWLRGDAAALSVEEQKGYQLFKSLGCISRHQGVNVGGNLFERHGSFIRSPRRNPTSSACQVCAMWQRRQPSINLWRQPSGKELTEQLKSDNALLQNSLAHFRRFSARISASDGSDPLAPAVSALAAAMLQLTLDTSPAAAREVADRLNELATQRFPLGTIDSVQALLGT